MTLDVLRGRLIAARDERAAALGRLLPDALAEGARSVVSLSLNVPGSDKNIPGVDAVFDRARAAVASLLGARLLDARRDALGPWAVFACRLAPSAAKRRCIGLEESLPAGRLVDLDVYGAGGNQADRAALGLPPRRCLVCDEPAVECMRTGRHGAEELRRAAVALLGDAR